jgi:hypothetical protein
MRKMKKYNAPVIIACVFVIIALCGTVSASMVLPLSLKDMSAAADAIYVGKCLNSRCYYPTKYKKAILTDYLVDISEVVSGPDQKTIIITVQGGRVGARASLVPGSPTYVTGEKVLIFLIKNKQKKWNTLGMAQGKFQIHKEQNTDKEMLRRDLGGLSFVDLKTNKVAEKPKDPAKMYLKDYIKQIRKYAKSAKKRNKKKKR